ncbi:4-hydroxy-3-methylbut-2-enyl diphosphate reductase [Fusibacter sp. JL216-2]|uniref:4-hydroxy-3-methylbut-2-enyl diphosphate reductase n=1 Tax=Fusibacter sp. JL216-2 TaxID=3071453 RepID=UPI003D34BA92
MKIEVATHAGFCYGVERAINITKEANESENKIYTYGPLIHNAQVVEKLEAEGIRAVDNINHANDGKLIVRSHGASESVFIEADEKKIDIIDATCPFVKKIQDKVRDYYDNGYGIIIIGDKKHPEVIGINGWCKNSAMIVNSLEDAKNIKDNGPTCMVVQTTFRYEIYEEILKVAQAKIKDLVAFNTICAATSKRQTAALDLARRVDAMIVIGGKHSSNTVKLAQICEQVCKKTYHIQTYLDLRVTELEKCDSIGITAGASTPNWIIDEIINKLEEA